MFGFGSFRTLAAAAALAITAGAASAATLTVEGITYSLTYSPTSSSDTRNFTLDITGINGATDTKGGRWGVVALAFGTPDGGSTQPDAVVAPTGFTYLAGGLNAGGCNGSGNFICFKNNTFPTAPALSAGSSLSYTFQITSVADPFPLSFSSDFKITWVGAKSNFDKKTGEFKSSGYDLVSLPLVADPVSPVPLPAAGFLLVGALGGLGALRRRRKSV